MIKLTNFLKHNKGSLLGIFVIAAVMFVGAFSVSKTASAQQAQPDVTVADIQYAATVRQGSSGQAVLIWQRFFNDFSVTAQLVEDGVFGPMTDAEARAWQRSRALVADGILGPLSRAAAMAQIQSGGPVNVYPTGCTSLVGYSPTTGVKCDSGVTNLPAGCTSTAGYSPTTGVKCDSGTTNLPAGCTSTAGYSPTTGIKCDSEVNGGTPSGNLSGGAGNLQDADFVSSINNEEVGEGQNDVEVLGLDLEADNGSDLRITSVRVEFEQTSGQTSSDDFDDYAEEVTIWFNGSQVGSVDVDDMSENNGVWSSSISLSNNTIIRAGDEERLIVAVSALNNIDSDDLRSAGSDSGGWDVGITSLRYEDAQGVFITETTLNDIGSETREFFFDTFSSANDVELSISETGDNPQSGTVQVDEDGGDEIVLAAGEIEAEGSDLEITGLEVVITPEGASVEEMVSRFILMIDGDEVDSIDADECDNVTDDCSNDNGEVATYFFSDFEFILDEGDTVDFEIVAEMLEFSGDFTQGDSLEASVDSDGIEAEDEAGDDLSAGEKTGTVNGETQRLFFEGISASNFSSSVATSSSNGVNTRQTYTISYDLTAFGETFYIPKPVERGDLSDNDTSGLAYLVINSSGNVASSANVASASSPLTSNATTTNNYFRISEGQTNRFTVVVELTPGNSADFYQVRLNDALYDLNQTAVGTDENIYNFTPTQDFETDPRSLPVA